MTSGVFLGSPRFPIWRSTGTTKTQVITEKNTKTKTNLDDDGMNMECESDEDEDEG